MSVDACDVRVACVHVVVFYSHSYMNDAATCWPGHHARCTLPSCTSTWNSRSHRQSYHILSSHHACCQLGSQVQQRMLLLLLAAHPHKAFRHPAAHGATRLTHHAAPSW
jgi:hypothetical protein